MVKNLENPWALALYFLIRYVGTDCKKEKVRQDIADYEFRGRYPALGHLLFSIFFKLT